MLPHDHDEILPEDGIIRRISNQQIIFDEKINGRRISSQAFRTSSAGWSVDLEKQIEEAGINVREFVTTPHWTGSIRFQAGPIRAEAFKVGFDPVLDNPYHGEVWGDFNRSKRRKLRQLCEWLVPIPNAVIGDE